MDRRAFLASGVVGVAAATAGCSALGGTTELDPVETTVEANGREKHLVFEHQNSRRAVVTLQQMAAQSATTAPFEFRLHVDHRRQGTSDSTVKRFRFDLRTPVTSTDLPAEIYLEPVGSAGWPARIEQVDDQWTRITVDDASDFGSGSITLSTLVQPHDPISRIEVRAEVDLERGGFASPTHRLEAETRFEPVVEE